MVVHGCQVRTAELFLERHFGLAPISVGENSKISYLIRTQLKLEIVMYLELKIEFFYIFAIEGQVFHFLEMTVFVSHSVASNNQEMSTRAGALQRLQ